MQARSASEGIRDGEHIFPRWRFGLGWDTVKAPLTTSQLQALFLPRGDASESMTERHVHRPLVGVAHHVGLGRGVAHVGAVGGGGAAVVEHDEPEAAMPEGLVRAAVAEEPLHGSEGGGPGITGPPYAYFLSSTSRHRGCCIPFDRKPPAGAGGLDVA